MKSLKVEFYRASKGSGIIIAPVLILILLLQEGFSTGLSEAINGEATTVTNVELFGMTVFFASIVLLIPLLASIPFGAAFCEEIETGVFYFTLHRKTLFGYIRDKIITVWCTGFAVTFIPVLTYGIICTLFAQPFDLSLEEHRQILENTAWQAILTDGGFTYILFQSFFIGCFGASCALSALTASAFFPNKYFTWCFPLILCFSLNFITPRLNLAPVNPIQSFDPAYKALNLSGEWSGIIYMTAYHLTVLIICFVVFYIGIVRRFFNGTVNLSHFAVKKMEK